MKVLMFMPRFGQLVKAGLKRQTVRPFRKIPIVVGDELSLRIWSDMPYRSPQIILKESVCTKTEPIWIYEDYISLKLEPFGMTGNYYDDDFAKADGFEDWKAMIKWFNETHGLPFIGNVIYWK